MLCICNYTCKEVEYTCTDGTTQSWAFYAKNISNEPIFVQSFYCPLDTVNDTLWCEKEPVAWSDIILLNSGDKKLIMDYVKPTCIKIYRYADTSLLLDVPNKIKNGPYYEPSCDAIKYSAQEEADIGEHLQDKGLCVHEESYYIRDDKYLFENIPWTYPIYFDQGGCSQKIDKNMLQERKERYANEANGYALLFCVTINADNL
jgi:hypothetical protein